MEGQAEHTRFEERYAVDAPQVQAGRCNTMCFMAGRMLARLRNQRHRSKDQGVGARTERPTLDDPATVGTMTMELSPWHADKATTSVALDCVALDQSYTGLSGDFLGHEPPPRVTLLLDGCDTGLTGSCAFDDFAPPPDSTMALDEMSIHSLRTLDEDGSPFGTYEPDGLEDDEDGDQAGMRPTETDMHINVHQPMRTRATSTQTHYTGQTLPHQKHLPVPDGHETSSSRSRARGSTGGMTPSESQSSRSSDMFKLYSASGLSEDWDAGMDLGLSLRSRTEKTAPKSGASPGGHTAKSPAAHNVFDDDDLALDLLLLS